MEHITESIYGYKMKKIEYLFDAGIFLIGFVTGVLLFKEMYVFSIMLFVGLLMMITAQVFKEIKWII